MIYFSGNGGITGAGLPPNPVTTAGAAVSKDEPPKPLVVVLLVGPELDPNPDAPGVEPNEPEPKLPADAGTLDVAGVLNPFDPPVVNVGLGKPAGVADCPASFSCVRP